MCTCDASIPTHTLFVGTPAPAIILRAFAVLKRHVQEGIDLVKAMVRGDAGANLAKYVKIAIDMTKEVANAEIKLLKDGNVKTILGMVSMYGFPLVNTIAAPIASKWPKPQKGEILLAGITAIKTAVTSINADSNGISVPGFVVSNVAMVERITTAALDPTKKPTDVAALAIEEVSKVLAAAMKDGSMPKSIQELVTPGFSIVTSMTGPSMNGFATHETLAIGISAIKDVVVKTTAVPPAIAKAMELLDPLVPTLLKVNTAAAVSALNKIGGEAKSARRKRRAEAASPLEALVGMVNAITSVVTPMLAAKITAKTALTDSEKIIKALLPLLSTTTVMAATGASAAAIKAATTTAAELLKTKESGVAKVAVTAVISWLASQPGTMTALATVAGVYNEVIGKALSGVSISDQRGVESVLQIAKAMGLKLTSTGGTPLTAIVEAMGLIGAKAKAISTCPKIVKLAVKLGQDVLAVVTKEGTSFDAVSAALKTISTEVGVTFSTVQLTQNLPLIVVTMFELSGAVASVVGKGGTSFDMVSAAVTVTNKNIQQVAAVPAIVKDVFSLGVAVVASLASVGYNTAEEFKAIHGIAIVASVLAEMESITAKKPNGAVPHKLVTTTFSLGKAVCSVIGKGGGVFAAIAAALGEVEGFAKAGGINMGVLPKAVSAISKVLVEVLVVDPKSTSSREALNTALQAAEDTVVGYPLMTGVLKVSKPIAIAVQRHNGGGNMIEVALAMFNEMVPLIIKAGVPPAVETALQRALIVGSALARSGGTALGAAAAAMGLVQSFTETIPGCPEVVKIGVKISQEALVVASKSGNSFEAVSGAFKSIKTATTKISGVHPVILVALEFGEEVLAAVGDRAAPLDIVLAAVVTTETAIKRIDNPKVPLLVMDIIGLGRSVVSALAKNSEGTLTSINEIAVVAAVLKEIEVVATKKGAPPLLTSVISLGTVVAYEMGTGGNAFDAIGAAIGVVQGMARQIREANPALKNVMPVVEAGLGISAKVVPILGDCGSPRDVATAVFKELVDLGLLEVGKKLLSDMVAQLKKDKIIPDPLLNELMTHGMTVVTKVSEKAMAGAPTPEVFTTGITAMIDVVVDNFDVPPEVKGALYFIAPLAHKLLDESGLLVRADKRACVFGARPTKRRRRATSSAQAKPMSPITALAAAVEVLETLVGKPVDVVICGRSLTDRLGVSSLTDGEGIAKSIVSTLKAITDAATEWAEGDGAGDCKAMIIDAIMTEAAKQATAAGVPSSVTDAIAAVKQVSPTSATATQQKTLKLAAAKTAAKDFPGLSLALDIAEGVTKPDKPTLNAPPEVLAAAKQLCDIIGNAFRAFDEAVTKLLIEAAVPPEVQAALRIAQIMANALVAPGGTPLKAIAAGLAEVKTLTDTAPNCPPMVKAAITLGQDVLSVVNNNGSPFEVVAAALASMATIAKDIPGTPMIVSPALTLGSALVSSVGKAMKEDGTVIGVISAALHATSKTFEKIEGVPPLALEMVALGDTLVASLAKVNKEGSEGKAGKGQRAAFEAVAAALGELEKITEKRGAPKLLVSAVSLGEALAGEMGRGGNAFGAVAAGIREIQALAKKTTGVPEVAVAALGMGAVVTSAIGEGKTPVHVAAAALGEVKTRASEMTNPACPPLVFAMISTSNAVVASIASSAGQQNLQRAFGAVAAAMDQIRAFVVSDWAKSQGIPTWVGTVLTIGSKIITEIHEGRWYYKGAKVALGELKLFMERETEVLAGVPAAAKPILMGLLAVGHSVASALEERTSGVLVAEKKICATNNDFNFGTQTSLEACAEKCQARTGCAYFIYGPRCPAGKQSGGCLMQDVKADDCGSSIQLKANNAYNLYKVGKVGGPPGNAIVAALAEVKKLGLSDETFPVDLGNNKWLIGAALRIAHAAIDAVTSSEASCSLATEALAASVVVLQELAVEKNMPAPVIASFSVASAAMNAAAAGKSPLQVFAAAVTSAKGLAVKNVPTTSILSRTAVIGVFSLAEAATNAIASDGSPLDVMHASIEATHAFIKDLQVPATLNAIAAATAGLDSAKLKTILQVTEAVLGLVKAVSTVIANGGDFAHGLAEGISAAGPVATAAGAPKVVGQVITLIGAVVSTVAEGGGMFAATHTTISQAAILANGVAGIPDNVKMVLTLTDTVVNALSKGGKFDDVIASAVSEIKVVAAKANAPAGVITAIGVVEALFKIQQKVTTAGPTSCPFCQYLDASSKKCAICSANTYQSNNKNSGDKNSCKSSFCSAKKDDTAVPAWAQVEATKPCPGPDSSVASSNTAGNIVEYAMKIMSSNGGRMPIGDGNSRFELFTGFWSRIGVKWVPSGDLKNKVWPRLVPELGLALDPRLGTQAGTGKLDGDDVMAPTYSDFKSNIEQHGFGSIKRGGLDYELPMFFRQVLAPTFTRMNVDASLRWQDLGEVVNCIAGDCSKPPANSPFKIDLQLSVELKNLIGNIPAVKGFQTGQTSCNTFCGMFEGETKNPTGLWDWTEWRLAFPEHGFDKWINSLDPKTQHYLVGGDAGPTGGIAERLDAVMVVAAEAQAKVTGCAFDAPQCVASKLSKSGLAAVLTAGNQLTTPPQSSGADDFLSAGISFLTTGPVVDDPFYKELERCLTKDILLIDCAGTYWSRHFGPFSALSAAKVKRDKIRFDLWQTAYKKLTTPAARDLELMQARHFSATLFAPFDHMSYYYGGSSRSQVCSSIQYS